MNNMIIKYENNNELSFQYHTPFIFSEFDSWVRSRYGIPNNVGLIIQDENEIGKWNGNKILFLILIILI